MYTSTKTTMFKYYLDALFHKFYWMRGWTHSLVYKKI